MGDVPHPLDNLIWNSLGTRHSCFCKSSGNARKFIDEISPLGAFQGDENEAMISFAEIVPVGVTLGLFLFNEFEPRDGWEIVACVPLLEMVRDPTVPLNFVDSDRIVVLGDEDAAEMRELVELTKPGPFGSRTHHLGCYYGIRCESSGRLISVSGERMKVPGYTEVSAVCTHPDYLGKGYARTLMGKVIGGIEKRGERALLHVRANNDRAIRLYEQLGFSQRWSGYYALLRKT